jgi:hypothetical protein
MFFRAKDKRSNQIGLHRTFQALRKAGGCKRNERTGIARGRTGFNYMAVSPADRINYTLDHLVPLEIGGADVIENLWPEPRRSLAGEGDDTRKDQLERRLAALVCSGELDVSEAQKAIAEDWPGAYKQYFEPINIFPPAAGRRRERRDDDDDSPRASSATPYRGIEMAEISDTLFVRKAIAYDDRETKSATVNGEADVDILARTAARPTVSDTVGELVGLRRPDPRRP